MLRGTKKRPTDRAISEITFPSGINIPMLIINSENYHNMNCKSVAGERAAP